MMRQAKPRAKEEILKALDPVVKEWFFSMGWHKVFKGEIYLLSYVLRWAIKRRNS